MLFLDICFRIAGSALLLAQAGLVWRDARDIRPARFGALLAISLAGVLLTDTTHGLTLPLEVRFILLFLSMNSAIFIWWFTLSLFDDDFRLRPLEWTVAALWFGLGMVNFNEIAHNEPLSALWAAYARTVIALGFAGHIIYTALAGRNADLVESRRRIRVFLSIAITVLFLVDLASEVLFGYLTVPLWFSTLHSGAFFAVVIWTFFWLNRMDKHVLMFDRQPEAPAPSAPALTPREKLLREKLIAAVESEKAYLEPDLSIAALAARIDAPEHQVRALINKAMGHRNFRAFLNGYRMEDAKAALADPQKSNLPILTIAMDSGFASLSSFNRAFKEAVGDTPSAWRQARAGGDTPPQN